MSETTTSTNPDPTPPELVDPGIIAGTKILGFVPLQGPEAEAAVRLRATMPNENILWNNLVTLKVLLPEASREIVINHYGNDILAKIVDSLLHDIRGGAR